MAPLALVPTRSTLRKLKLENIGFPGASDAAKARRCHLRLVSSFMNLKASGVPHDEISFALRAYA